MNLIQVLTRKTERIVFSMAKSVLCDLSFSHTSSIVYRTGAHWTVQVKQTGRKAHRDNLSAAAGLPAESDPDAVGEPDHGHAGVARARDGAAVRRAARAEAVRTHQAAHLPHHDEEHPRSRHLPAHSHLRAPLCRYVCAAWSWCNNHGVNLVHTGRVGCRAIGCFSQ